MRLIVNWLIENVLGKKSRRHRRRGSRRINNAILIGESNLTGIRIKIETLEDRTLFSAPGSLDARFGAGGIVSNEFWPTRVAVEADGEILVLGTPSLDSPLKLARFHRDGTLDVSFGEGGTLIDERSFAAGNLVVQADGKIIVGGELRNGFRSDAASLTRYLLDGRVDVSFGVNGLVAPNISSFDFVAGLVMQADGKIVATGHGVTARFEADGRLDSTFGTDGVAAIVLESTSDVALQSDGKVIVVGGATPFEVVRYLDDGSLDEDFGTNGRAVLDLAPQDGFLSSIVVQSDGKIVVGGTVYEDIEDVSSGALWVRTNHLLLVRFNANGSLDTSFGDNGRVVDDSAGGLTSMSLQGDGKILVATESGDALQRYDSNGTPDSTFGDQGRVISDLKENGFRAWDMALDQNGHAIIVGNTIRPAEKYDYLVARVNTEIVPSVATVRESETIPLTITELPPPAIIGPANRIVYRLATVPRHGQLLLNSVRLRAGTTFTQADVNAGRVAYRHNGSETPADRFDFSIVGPNRQSLPRQTFFIGVTPINDAPTLDRISASGSFRENAAPLRFAKSVVVTDPDTDNFDGGLLTVTITDGGEESDRLFVQSGGTGNQQVTVRQITAAPDAPSLSPDYGSLFGGDYIVKLTVSGEAVDIGRLYESENLIRVTFNRNATREAVQAVLRQITFQNTSDDPSPRDRIIRTTLTDGDGGTSNTTETRIRVIPIDDRPRFDQFNSRIDAVVSEPARRLMPNVTVSDSDLKQLNGAVLEVQSKQVPSIIPGDGVWIDSSNVRVDDRTIGTVLRVAPRMTVRFNADASIEDVTRVARRLAVEARSKPGQMGKAEVWFADPSGVQSNRAVIAVHSIARTTASEHIVATRIRNQNVTGVTIITHGFQPIGRNSDSLHPLARAIWERTDASNGDDSAWLLDLDELVVNTGYYVFDTSPIDGVPVLPPDGETLRGEVVLLFDWAADSNNIVDPSRAEENAARLYQLLVTLGLVDPEQHEANSIPLHFIGHSFGAAITSEVVEQLARDRIAVDQVTYLDPHDFDQGPFSGFDGHQQLFTLGQPQFDSTVPSRAYVANLRSDFVSVIDTTTNAVVSQIPVGAGQFTIDVSPDGTRAYAALVDCSDLSCDPWGRVHNVAVIDTVAGRVLTTIQDVGLHLADVTVSPLGDIVLLTDHLNSVVRVLSTSDNRVVASIPVGSAPDQVAFSPDGRFAYTSNILSATVSVIDTSQLQVVATIGDVGAGANTVAASPDGARLFVGSHWNGVSVIDTASNTVFVNVPLNAPNGPVVGMTLSPDGRKLYVTDRHHGFASAQTPNNLWVINTVTNSVESRISIDAGFDGGLAVSSDETIVYAAAATADTVLAIDTATSQVIQAIPVGNVPRAIAFASQSGNDHYGAQSDQDNNGYGATVWNNVAFADVYYQTLARPLIPNGRPIIGAYNVNLNERVGGPNPHSRVWDDFYLHSVIDTTATSEDTRNYGYSLSRLAGGDSLRPSPRFFDASQNHTFTSPRLVAFEVSDIIPGGVLVPIREPDGSFRRGDQPFDESVKFAPSSSA